MQQFLQAGPTFTICVSLKLPECCIQSNCFFAFSQYWILKKVGTRTQTMYFWTGCQPTPCSSNEERLSPLCEYSCCMSLLHPYRLILAAKIMSLGWLVVWFVGSLSAPCVVFRSAFLPETLKHFILCKQLCNRKVWQAQLMYYIAKGRVRESKKRAKTWM